MQVFNDVCVLAAVEDGQGPCVALVPYVGICWVDGDSSQVHHEVAGKDGAHTLHRLKVHFTHCWLGAHPCFLWLGNCSPPPCDSPTKRLLACATPFLPVRPLQHTQPQMEGDSSHLVTELTSQHRRLLPRGPEHRAVASLPQAWHRPWLV